MASEVTINDRTQQAVNQILGLTGDKLAEFVDIVTEISREEAPYRTGHLKASINHDRPATMQHRIFTQTGYGGYVHEGTIHQAANPFITRAIDRSIPEFVNSGPWVK